MSEDDKCKREDLRVVLNIPSFWGVNDDGSIDLGDSYGDGDADADNFDSYYCHNCCNFLSDDWQAALEHVDVKATA